MSYERNIQWLNDRRVNYRQEPINDEPTFSNDHYSYYEDGTHEYYRLFYTPSKITTYKSLKWHLLVLWYLNYDSMLTKEFVELAKFVANKENGFVTFFIGDSKLQQMINDVVLKGGDAPKNKARK
jgi:hypothetical protein